MPLRTEPDIFTNVSLRFLSHSNFATLTNRKRCNWTPRGRMYCARRPLACYVHDTRFAWAVRVAYSCWGQRRPECVVSQCGNPRFLWLSITITPEIPPCSIVGRSPSLPRASSLRPSRGQGVLRNRSRRNQRFPVAARKIRL